MTTEYTRYCVASVSSADQGNSDTKLKPYHKPSLVYYGALAELVQATPAVGSDGGVADCSHL